MEGLDRGSVFIVTTIIITIIITIINIIIITIITKMLLHGTVEWGLHGRLGARPRWRGGEGERAPLLERWRVSSILLTTLESQFNFN